MTSKRVLRTEITTLTAHDFPVIQAEAITSTNCTLFLGLDQQNLVLWAAPRTNLEQYEKASVYKSLLNQQFVKFIFHEDTQSIFIGTSDGRIEVVHLKRVIAPLIGDVYDFYLEHQMSILVFQNSAVTDLQLIKQKNVILATSANRIGIVHNIFTRNAVLKVKIEAGKLQHIMSFKLDEKRDIIYLSDKKQQVQLYQLFDIDQSCMRAEHICALGTHGHVGDITAIELNINKQLLFTGGKKENVCVWDVMHHGQPKLIYSVKDNTGSVSAIQFDHDAQILVAGDKSGAVVVWDANRTIVITRFIAHCVSLNGLILKGGKLITWGSDFLIKYWQLYEDTSTYMDYEEKLE
ncbi:Conserved_hypothetical protein [Hexamita inflata]|uniref:Uncharacterized protein n=1 Tax=Hexamita inflata TaxID=28002 RepID=A0ABP1HMI0_9EUKA